METFIEILKAAAWPAITLYFLLTYRDAINKILLQIPGKLRSASKLEVGSVKFELAASLEGSGDAELASVMQRLSRRAYQKIIELRDPNHHHHISTRSWTNEREEFYCLPPHAELDTLKELDAAKLIEFNQPLDRYIDTFISHPDAQRAGDVGRQHQIRASTLSDESKQYIESVSYALTREGRRLYEAMTDIIINQLAR